jgi:hypothetical protein
VVICRPTDFEPYGFRKRDGPDCSCGSKWFQEPAGQRGMDWGVCSHPQSPRSGLLTFEHMGCTFFECDPPDEDDFDLNVIINR